jgi:hypothetical protein
LDASSLFLRRRAAPLKRLIISTSKRSNLDILRRLR